MTENTTSSFVLHPVSSAFLGRFITFEGGEGGGKTTQSRLLAAALEERGIQCCLTREPGGSTGAEEIRRLLVEGEAERWDAITETLLLAAARRDHWLRTIKPALERGEWVLCDRFADSTRVYQGAGKNVSSTALEYLYALAVGGYEPDLTIILDAPVSLGLERALARGGAENRYEKLGAAFHDTLRQAFLALAQSQPKRCIVVDALGSIDDVHMRIFTQVSARLLDAHV